MEPREKRRRIGNIQAACMTAFAALFDGIQLVLTFLLIGAFVGWLFTALFWIIMSLWLLMSHVSFLDRGAGKLLAALGSVMIEILPLLNTLPGLTIAIVSIIFMVRAEDRRYNKEQASAQNAAA